jgi:hypothetical protein
MRGALPACRLRVAYAVYQFVRPDAAHLFDGRIDP